LVLQLALLASLAPVLGGASGGFEAGFSHKIALYQYWVMGVLPQSVTG
tara:strand:- start:180 stop:323 length:144 start_codon:yes stop_codon:yes gene_type:complete